MGGGGNRDFLADRMQPVFDALWAREELPPVVVATPSAGRSQYLDYRDGSQRWEELILTEFLPRLRGKFHVQAERSGTLVGGISMGGLGSLRLALKHPGVFAAVAALEPAIDPALAWEDVRWRHKFYRSDALFEEWFGSPFSADYWASNNPATIAGKNAAAITDSQLGIYFEVGDEDLLNLTEGVEFLHRVLFDHGIHHEYRLVRGGNHVGRTLAPRFGDALRFLDRQLRPDTAPDPQIDQALNSPMASARAEANAKSPPWRGEFAP